MNTLANAENPLLGGEVSPINPQIHTNDRVISDPNPAPISAANTGTEKSSDIPDLETDAIATDTTVDQSTTVNPADDAPTNTDDRIIADPNPAPVSVAKTDAIATDTTVDRSTTVSTTDDPSGVTSNPFPKLSIDPPNFPGFPDIIFPFKPDLSGKFFDIVQEPLKSGDSFNLNFEIKNTGLANAGGFWADFYLSSDNNISNAPGSSDTLLGYQWISGLAIGSTTGLLSKNLTLPDATSPIWDSIGNGTYYVGVISDALKNVAESNESNNASTGWFVDYDDVFVTAFPPGVDLSGQYFNVVQEPLNAGDNFDVNFEVKNTGSDNATGFWADFYLSADSDISNTFGSGDVLLGYQWIPSLAGGSTTGSLTKNLYLPNASHPIWDSIGDGTYYVGMISDALGSVTETNESNNDSTAEFVDYDGVLVNTSILNFDLDFNTNGQNLWGSGGALNIGHDQFFGPEWNASGSKTIASIGVQGSTSGKIGLQSNLDVDGGSVNASLPIDLWLDLPTQVQPGETVTLKSGFKLDNLANFSTSSPQASYALDLIFNVKAKAGLTAFGQNANIVDFNVNKTKNLVSIDSNSENYSIPKSTLNGFGSFDLHVPTINTNGNLSGTNSLSAQGSDQFFNASLDLDKVATTLFNAAGIPIPPLEASLSLLGTGVGYNLLDVELAGDLSLQQQFGLQVDDLTGQLVLENGQAIDFVVGQDVTFTVPDGIGDSLEVDALLNVGADFSNKTILGTDIDADLEALSVNAKVNFPWPIPDIDVTLGPLVDKTYDLFDGDVNLYNKTFALGGFNSESLSFDIPVAA
jgi:CARDB